MVWKKKVSKNFEIKKKDGWKFQISNHLFLLSQDKFQVRCARQYSIKRSKYLKLLFAKLEQAHSFFKGYGSDLPEERDMTYIIIHKHQLMKLKRIINEGDEEAFVFIRDVRKVLGGIFSWKSKV